MVKPVSPLDSTLMSLRSVGKFGSSAFTSSSSLEELLISWMSCVGGDRITAVGIWLMCGDGGRTVG